MTEELANQPSTPISAMIRSPQSYPGPRQTAAVPSQMIISAISNAGRSHREALSCATGQSHSLSARGAAR
ncbi:hypothetical protein D9M71_629960 [compost metagenome]